MGCPAILLRGSLPPHGNILSRNSHSHYVAKSRVGQEADRLSVGGGPSTQGEWDHVSSAAPWWRNHLEYPPARPISSGRNSTHQSSRQQANAPCQKRQAVCTHP